MEKLKLYNNTSSPCHFFIIVQADSNARKEKKLIRQCFVLGRHNADDSSGGAHVVNIRLPSCGCPFSQTVFIFNFCFVQADSKSFQTPARTAIGKTLTTRRKDISTGQLIS